MLQYDFQSSIGYWLHLAAHRFERAMNDELAAEGLTYRQGQVLAWLAHDHRLAQCELAERMNVEPPSLVPVLDRMEREGLISRESCESDRRRKDICPTPAANAVWLKVVACANRVRARSVGGLTTAEESTLHRLLRQVHNNLGPVGACADHCPPEESLESSSLPQT